MRNEPLRQTFRIPHSAFRVLFLAMRSVILLGLVCCLAPRASAQLRAADSLYDALKPAEALVFYQRLLARDTASPEVLWKAGRAMVDVAKQLEDDNRARQTRASLYNLAWIYGARSVRADSMNANGH